jgi:ABC-type multidrug transport system fused ATPase/permease subunit
MYLVNVLFFSQPFLCLTYYCSYLSKKFVVRSYAMVESAMTSVERVLYYSHEIPQEAAMTSDEFDVKAGTSFGGKKAIHTTKEWPESGSVTLSNLQMRYRTETPLVLKGLNVSIGAGERIGVVGRTGSGKSSMLLVLMRIVEPLISEDGEKYEAPLSIDGVDVMRIGLYDLRSKLGIIPQSPGETFSSGMPYA